MTKPPTPLAAASTAALLPDFERLFKRTTGDAVARPHGAPLSRAGFLAQVDSVASGLRTSAPVRMLACSDALNFAIGFCALLRAGKDIVLPANLQTGSLHHADVELLDDTLIDSLIATNTSSCDNADLPADGRIILFTSGSTGEPKRIEKQLRQLTAEANVLEARFGGRIQATITATVPHFHIYGLLFRIIWPLAAGRAFMAEPVLGANLHRARDNVLVSSPAFLRRIEPGDLARAAPRLIFSSGGKLPDDSARALAAAANCPLVEVYGSTETGGIAWREWNPDCDGKWTAFDGVELRLQEPAGRLHVRSAATNATWIDTGDAVSLEDVPRFVLHGRDDGVLKIEDKRVSAAALVACLDCHEWIAEARVIELRGGRGQLGAVARLSDKGQHAFDGASRKAFVNELKQYMQRHFDAVVVPRKWRFVDELPVNALGKTTQAALMAMFDHAGERS